jgi:hypothetical protein
MMISPCNVCNVLKIGIFLHILVSPAFINFFILLITLIELDADIYSILVYKYFFWKTNILHQTNILVQNSGDLPQRLCGPDEVKFYFSSLYDRDGDKNINLKTNINCNMSSWGKGCDAGWACATDPVPDRPSNRGSNDIPLRTSSCQACCEGFFCPRGLTCMLREFHSSISRVLNTFAFGLFNIDWFHSSWRQLAH